MIRQIFRGCRDAGDPALCAIPAYFLALDKKRKQVRLDVWTNPLVIDRSGARFAIGRLIDSNTKPGTLEPTPGRNRTDVNFPDAAKPLQGQTSS